MEGGMEGGRDGEKEGWRKGWREGGMEERMEGGRDGGRDGGLYLYSCPNDVQGVSDGGCNAPGAHSAVDLDQRDRENFCQPPLNIPPEQPSVGHPPDGTDKRGGRDRGGEVQEGTDIQINHALVNIINQGPGWEGF